MSFSGVFFQPRLALKISDDGIELDILSMPAVPRHGTTVVTDGNGVVTLCLCNPRSGKVMLRHERPRDKQEKYGGGQAENRESGDASALGCFGNAIECDEDRPDRKNQPTKTEE